MRNLAPLTPAQGASHARAFDRRLIRLALHERKALAGAVALGLIIAAARVGQGIALALGIATVFNGERWSRVVPYLAVGVALVAVRAVAIAWQGSAMAGASVRITTDLRIRLVASILKLGPGWLVHERTGELEAVMVDGVEKLDAYFRLFLAKVIVAALTAVTVVIVVIAIDPVAGAVIAAFALVVVLLPSWEYRALGSRMAFWSDNYRPLSAEFVDNLQGMSTLKTFGVARRRGEELAARSADVRDAAIKLISTSGIFWGLMLFAAGAGVAAGLTIGAFRLASGDLTTRQLFLILLLAGECFLPAREIHDAMHLAVWGMSKVERAFSVLTETPRPRRPAHDRRPARASRLRTGTPVRRRRLPLPPRRARRPGRGELLGGGGRDAGHRRRLGSGKDHHRVVGPAVLRPDPGADHDGRHRPA